jgi:hypothetical protein
MISDIYKGDNIEFECNANEVITGWKIRCEIWDDATHDIKKATANSGGSDAQIKITDAAHGLFSIYILKGETTGFNDISYIEIEIETSDGKVSTVYRDTIKFSTEKINWVTP